MGPSDRHERLQEIFLAARALEGDERERYLQEACGEDRELRREIDALLEHDVQPITVSTYDSAWMHMEHLGARFGLLIFDEVHHLPGESYALAARLSLEITSEIQRRFVAFGARQLGTIAHDQNLSLPFFTLGWLPA